MKFIHMSDLHLGSPFAGLSAEEAARRYDSQFSVLDAVLRKAASMKIGLVLISGDVFDDIVVSQKTVSGFFRRLAGYPGISFVISPGNHDYYTPEGYYSGAGIPENVFIFRSDELTKFEFPELGADVYGFAFTSDSKFGPPALIPDDGAFDGDDDPVADRCITVVGTAKHTDAKDFLSTAVVGNR